MKCERRSKTLPLKLTEAIVCRRRARFSVERQHPGPASVGYRLGAGGRN